jgi:hypothetical protein
MRKYVVSLLAFFSVLQTPHALAEGSVRGGFPFRGFMVRVGPRHFVRPSVIIANPGPARFVGVSLFAREVIILSHHHFVGNTVIIREPFFFHHGIGFINEASFFHHLHQFDSLVFKATPSVIIHNGSTVIFFGN